MIKNSIINAAFTITLFYCVFESSCIVEMSSASPGKNWQFRLLQKSRRYETGKLRTKRKLLHSIILSIKNTLHKNYLQQFQQTDQLGIYPLKKNTNCCTSVTKMATLLSATKSLCTSPS
jgi:hypothetical protein